MSFIKRLQEQRNTLHAKAKGILDTAEAESRDLSDAETTEFDQVNGQIRSLDERISGLADDERRTRDSEETFRTLLGGDTAAPVTRSLGEHFAQHAGQQMLAARGVQGASVSAPEFRANTDTQVTSGSVYAPVLTTYDRTIVNAVRQRLVLADLLGSGTLTGNAISYFVEGALEGAVATVAEAGVKPQLHLVDPTMATDALKKVAGWIKVSDEMIDDLDFIMSEINNRLVYNLSLFEEAQLLNGAGTGSTIKGILNRSGIQTEARGNGASGDSAADTIFRAITKVQTGSGLAADGLIIHPADYQSLRLAKDANNQYYGGGFFAGPYGNGSVMEQPPVWGLRTVVSPAIDAGTVLVGAFQQAATVYRKGGVRVESTNSHASDFTSNLVTIRVEERVALAVRMPSAFVTTTITAAV